MIDRFELLRYMRARACHDRPSEIDWNIAKAPREVVVVVDPAGLGQVESSRVASRRSSFYSGNINYS